MTSAAPLKPQFVTVGDNPARAFGMGAAERANALAAKAKLVPVENASADGSTVYADLTWTWDPEWLVALAEREDKPLQFGHVQCRRRPLAGNVGDQDA